MKKYFQYNNSVILFSFTVSMVLISGVVYEVFKKCRHKSILSTSERIYRVMDEYRVTYDIDKRSIEPDFQAPIQDPVGVEGCLNNISRFVRDNKPISMVLLSFPFKSGNQEKKVISCAADMAEYKSLEYLQSMLDKIKVVYSPGAKLTIFCDGILFCQYLGIDQSKVIDYEKQIKRLVQSFTDIIICSSEDVIADYQLKIPDEINYMIDKYAPNDEKFRSELKDIPNSALARFGLELDHFKGRGIIDKYGVKEVVTQILSREMRLRSFIADRYPSDQYFRLTGHLSSDLGKKFGIKLSPNSDVTPYHGALVEEADGSWFIKFKKDIDTNFYDLQKQTINNVECYYYKATKKDFSNE